MLKIIGYRMFALIYYICRLFPAGDKRVLCIKTHEEGKGSNVSIVEQALMEKNTGYTFSYIRKSDTLAVKGFKDIRSLLSFFVIKPYQLARARIILQDNIFLPFAYLHLKKGVKVIQLWHGTGTIKKFGQDVNTGTLKELEKRANQRITHLIVNSYEMKKLYAGAFGIKEDKIYPIGLPKTDELLRNLQLNYIQQHFNRDKAYIYNKYAIPSDRKLILYAPTFRDDEANKPSSLHKLEELIKTLPSDYHLGIRLHPFIAKAAETMFFTDSQIEERICQLSFEEDMSALLLAADILITDYSSVIFEYCLMERPILFYAYDLKEFSDNGRGFYYEYESYVPGPVVYTANEVGEIIRSNQFDIERIKSFKQKNFPYLDGKATERLLELIEEDNMR
ncbi:CDP-glycerol glycerophosphotransferase family protein [Mobilitalea sibirica]|uniref:CDP-glycerol glycerophosphotransferase family protein n=1 Tax=Mobilitalea sibirica TaxID=1462919 RepID=A0A8J7H5U1_9FIRM|nr:CDP-glycerol glycerophosphotransferase family protein [Mobilitalea sibirica]MBH1940366.1 CDP-glycerol glycerophosphotransferase family protein [Mobilitalea sibirica]